MTYITTPQTRLGNGIMKKMNIEDIFPVNSIYIGTMTECPIALLIPNSTWTKIASNLLIGTSDVPVVGNGKGLGLTNNSQSGVLTSVDPHASAHQSIGYGTNNVAIGTSTGSASMKFTNYTAIGVSTDTTNSGLVAKISSLSLACNIWKRTA